MSRWPDDPTSYRPSARWLGVVVVVVMLGIFAVIGTFMWMSARHSALVWQLAGAWTESSPGSESRLQISGGAGDLFVEGSIAGRQVSGGIDVPRTGGACSVISASTTARGSCATTTRGERSSSRAWMARS